jgi:hypothetical protein
VSKKNLSDSAHTKLPDEKPGIESMQSENIKEKAPQLLENLPDSATWEELMYSANFLG